MSATKKRPALVESPDAYNQSGDIVIAFITSNLKALPKHGDYIIKEWKTANLPKPSMIRMKFATISKEIVLRQLGHLSVSGAGEFEQKLIDFFRK